MIQKSRLLLASLVVLWASHGITTVEAAESPKTIKSKPTENRWALILTAPGGDPVELSRWQYRETCEMVRENMLRMALRKGATVPGTRCVALSWRIWLRYLSFRYLVTERGKTFDGERRTNLDFDIEEYLEKAVDLGTLQQDVAIEFGAPLLVKKLSAGRITWTYESRWRTISLGDGKPLTPPHVRCFILTFDQDKILREWRVEQRQSNCSGARVPPRELTNEGAASGSRLVGLLPKSKFLVQ